MNRSSRLYIILSGIFLTMLLLAEITGGKLIRLRLSEDWVFIMTMGVVPFPITFLITDLINEYYGRKGIRFVTLLGMTMIALAYGVLFIDMQIPAAPESPVTDEMFNGTFGQSARIIVGSLTAYLIGQLIDIHIFFRLRRATHGKYLWLRATGSTIVSQLMDSFIVLFIAFYDPLTVLQILNIGLTNYLYKFLIAVLLTPLIYLSHYWIDRYLGDEVHTLPGKAENTAG